MRDQAVVETAVVDALLEGSVACASLTDDELLVALDELGARRRVLDAALVRAAGEVAARSDGLPADASLVRRSGHATLAQLLQHRVGLRLHEARRLCVVAEATRARVTLTGAPLPVQHPHVAAALAPGWLSVAQADAIVAGLDAADGRAPVDAVDQAEAFLVAAGCGTAAHDDAPAVPETLAALARACLAYLDPDGAEPRHEAQLAARFLTLRRRADGLVAGRFLCTTEQGEILEAALDAHVGPRRPSFEDVGDAPSEGEVAAIGRLDDTSTLHDTDTDTDHALPGRTTAGDAAADQPSADETSSTDAIDADRTSADAPAVDDRSRDQRRIDALVAIVGRHAETRAPRVGGEAPVLVVTVSREALHGRRDGIADVPRLERSGDPVPIAVAARILCDGFVQPVVQGEHAEPLRLGRRRRLFSRSQRRAIIARDRHCRAPGCTAPAGWCETHHVTRWADDGATDVDNGILLCRHHHTEVHRGALAIAPGTRTRWSITTAHARRPRTRAPSSA
ncbi:HNH endonuclease signature motif containing protein [Agrococcus versicolor]|uniref:HNH endonuclease signature motif containing protein n=1 Tax=Agrococcus versicolor TaxID=501482 RepID=A0ABN3AKS4_9MICO